MKASNSRAKCKDGYSSYDLKKLGNNLVTILRLIFNKAISTGRMLEKFLNNHFFFIHKAGDVKDPKNYRSICVQNPILKIFMKILNNKIIEMLEAENTLPNFQMGFRKGRNTVSAAWTLKSICSKRLNDKKKTFLCFVDFSKAFTYVDRKNLFDMMAKTGIPVSIINIIAFIYNKTNISFKSATGFLNKVIQARVGVPEGCTLSPTLFALYLSDLDEHLTPTTIKLGNTKIVYLAFADDICITCGSEDEMRENLKSLEYYCKIKKMVINVEKTKTMIVHKGRLPNIQPFNINQANLENVKKYKYLGLWFTTSMNFNEHIKYITLKVRSKIGYLWKMLNIGRLSLELALKVFDCYIKPIFTYGIEVWWQNMNKNMVLMINATFTKYLKMWLNIPVGSINSLVYFITKTRKLNISLEKDFLNQMTKIHLPHLEEHVINEHIQCNLQTHNTTVHNIEKDFTDNIKEIPSYLWFNKTCHEVPKQPKLRRKLMLDIFGWNHREFCLNNKFHVPYLHLNETRSQYDHMHDNAKPKTYCVCSICGETEIGFNHNYYCSGLL